MTEEITGLLGAINRLAERVRLLEEIENFVGNDVIAPAYTAPIGTVHWDSNLRQLWGNFDGTAIGWQLIGGGGVAAHNLLNGVVHPDTVLQGVTRGSMIYGNATPAWDELVHPGTDRLLITDANDVLWSDTNFTYGYTLGELYIKAKNDAATPLTIRANSATQTANISEWQRSTGATGMVIDNVGNVAMGLGVATTGFNTLRISEVETTTANAQTWSALLCGTAITINHTTATIRAAECENRISAGTNAPTEMTGVVGLSAYSNNVASIPSYVVGVRGQASLASASNASFVEGVRGICDVSSTSAAIPIGGHFLASRTSTTAGQARAGQFSLSTTATGNISSGYSILIRPATAAGGSTFTSNYGIYIEDQTVATNNWALVTNAGNVVFNEGGNINTDFRVEGDNVQYLIYADAGLDRVGIGKSVPDVRLHNYLSSAVTNAITDIVKIEHESTGTPAAGFGAGLRYSLESSTTVNQDAAQISALWGDATHATRSATLTFDVVSNASELEFLRLDGGGGGRPESVFNEGGQDIDLRVESLVENDSLFVEGSSGWTGIGTNAPNMKLTIYEVETLNGNVADGYAAGVQLDPGYTAGFTVTRHNYIDVNDVSTAGGAAVTNAAVMRFDAAFGTHKATTAGFNTTDSNGDTTAWAGGIIVNVNGTLYKLPAVAV